jgi:hypothetical protein
VYYTGISTASDVAMMVALLFDHWDGEEQAAGDFRAVAWYFSQIAFSIVHGAFFARKTNGTADGMCPMPTNSILQETSLWRGSVRVNFTIYLLLLDKMHIPYT